MNLKDILKKIDKKWYGVGDGNHVYAFGYIDKELGNELIKKYEYIVQGDGCTIQSLLNFQLYDIPEKWDLKDLYKELLRYFEPFDKYKNFQDFLIGENLEFLYYEFSRGSN